jgi:hypothetical protein
MEEEIKEEYKNASDRLLNSKGTIKCVWPHYHGRVKCPLCGVQHQEGKRTIHTVKMHTLASNIAKYEFAWLNSRNRKKFIQYGLTHLQIEATEPQDEIERKIEGINTSILSF